MVISQKFRYRPRGLVTTVRRESEVNGSNGLRKEMNLRLKEQDEGYSRGIPSRCSDHRSIYGTWDYYTSFRSTASEISVRAIGIG